MNKFIQRPIEMFLVANHHYFYAMLRQCQIPSIYKLKFTIIKTTYESMFQNNDNIFDGHIYIRVHMEFRNVIKERECIS